MIDMRHRQTHGESDYNSTDSSPDAVQHVSIWEDSNVQIGSQNVVKTSNLLISKESVGHPDFGRIDQCQVFDVICNGGGEPCSHNEH